MKTLLWYGCIAHNNCLAKYFEFRTEAAKKAQLEISSLVLTEYYVSARNSTQCVNKFPIWQYLINYRAVSTSYVVANWKSAYANSSLSWSVLFWASVIPYLLDVCDVSYLFLFLFLLTAFMYFYVYYSFVIRFISFLF